jgi:hypothetical protein
LGAMFINSINNDNILNTKRNPSLPSPLPPNQSLKLTEPAVGDFARAKQPVTIGQDLSRADWIPSLRHIVAAA